MGGHFHEMAGKCQVSDCYIISTVLMSARGVLVYNKYYKAFTIIMRTYVIPPALPEVRQVHLQSVLKQLKANTEHSQQKPVSHYQRLWEGKTNKHCS